MAIFFIERAILIFANAIIEPFFGRIEQKHALSGSFYQRHPIDYKIFIFMGQPLYSVTEWPCRNRQAFKKVRRQIIQSSVPIKSGPSYPTSLMQDAGVFFHQTPQS